MKYEYGVASIKEREPPRRVWSISTRKGKAETFTDFNLGRTDKTLCSVFPSYFLTRPITDHSKYTSVDGRVNLSPSTQPCLQPAGKMAASHQRGDPEDVAGGAQST